MKMNIPLRRLGDAFSGGPPERDNPDNRREAPIRIELPLTLWADVANAVWGLQQKTCAPNSGDERNEYRPLARHIQRLAECLSEIGITTQDHTNQLFDPGQSLDVLAFQPTIGINREIVLETLRPTVYLMGTRIQMGQVIVGTPQALSETARN